MRTRQPDVLDDLLEITFIHVPTSRVLKRARFHLRADDATHNWIRGHPTFSRGCWPVGLFLLHDWMWEKKFIDVEGREIIDGGMIDPNVLTNYNRGGITSTRAKLRVFESADHSGGDRTLDPAGAARH
jgi:hypothetical protein